MTGTAVQWRRVTVVDGVDRREILVSTLSPLSDSLRNEGIDLESRSVVVIASDGSRIDVSLVSTVADGALLTVVEPQPAGSAKTLPRGRVGAGALDFTGVLWISAASVAAIVAMVTALAGGPGGAVEGLAALRYAAAAVFALLAVVAILTIRPHRSTQKPGTVFSATFVVVPAMLAFSAGFLAIPTALEASVHLAIFAGCAAAALATGSAAHRALERFVHEAADRLAEIVPAAPATGTAAPTRAAATTTAAMPAAAAAAAAAEVEADILPTGKAFKALTVF